MAIPSELSPDLMDLSGLDVTTPLDQLQAQQMQAWGLPIRPMASHARRQQEGAIANILQQNELANLMRHDLARGQLASDARGQDFDLAAAVAPAFAETNEQGIAQLAPVQEITQDGGAGLDAILGSGDMVNRSKTLADAAKAQAEAENEPLRAKAAMVSAQNAGDDDGNIEAELGPDGKFIGFKIKGLDSLPTGPINRSQDSFESAPAEIPSNKTSGRRLIRNSDGSGVIITEDGQKVTVSPENMKAYGF